MIFLLNPERVLLESLELARLKIAEKAAVPANKIGARLEAKEGKIVPVFQVHSEIAGAWEKSYTEQLMRDVWKSIQPEMVTRLRGLLEERYGCGKSPEGEAAQGADAEDGCGEPVRGLDRGGDGGDRGGGAG